MTHAQQTALDQITELMREHFDSAIIVVEVDAGTDSDPTLQHLSYRVAGGFASSLGLIEYAKDKILHARSANETA